MLLIVHASVVAVHIQPHSIHSPADARPSPSCNAAASTQSRPKALCLGGSHGESGRIISQARTERGRSGVRKGGAVMRRLRPTVSCRPALAAPGPPAGARPGLIGLRGAPSNRLTSSTSAVCALGPDCSPPARGCWARSSAWLPKRAPAPAACRPSPNPTASAGAAPWPAAACARGPPPAAKADRLGTLSGGAGGSAGYGGRAARAPSMPLAGPAGSSVWVGAGCGSAVVVMGRAGRAPLADGGPKPPGAGFVWGRDDSMGAQAPNAAKAVDAHAGWSGAGSG